LKIKKAITGLTNTLSASLGAGVFAGKK